MNVKILRDIVMNNAIPPLNRETFEIDSSFVELGYDSLQFIKLIVDIEEKFNISVLDEFLDPIYFSNYQNFELAILNLLGVKNA